MATELQQRLFKQVTTETVKETKSPSDSNINNDGKDQGEPAKILTLSEEFLIFLNEPGRQIKEVQSVGAQIINKEMRCLKLPKRDWRI